MDPVSHSLAAMGAAHLVGGQTLGRRVLWVGLLAGFLPDIDVLFRWGGDGLSHLYLHRHFTHSLLLMPVGATLAAAPFLRGAAWQEHRGVLWLSALAAYASHLFLDLLTSYGTLVYWPFSSQRVAWDILAIVDLPFTLLLLGLLLTSVFSPSRPAVGVALLLVALWIGFGIVQRERGLALQAALAARRGHGERYGRVIPTLGNPFVWRSIYRAGDRLYADAIRLPLWGTGQIEPGESLPLVVPPTLAADLPAPERAQVERFAWFADGFLAWAPHDPQILCDMRYSRTPGAFQPLWGIRLAKGESPRLVRFGLRSSPAAGSAPGTTDPGPG
ncbi:MAG: membrane-bound metal-dependent hydrolase [Candidatus Ozemobacter sibiricus]|uniref:Membrane-bound metal-dependent hydrolase n=1 Tax=Candidatus Ozemobacter sibiricus TaxID=2268124 RepID=A0A367ZQW1_9BACT|nr:MAG: membrane-bound metal-dependent hydrolase [Candidatus Ozemobacter sibiricus]